MVVTDVRLLWILLAALLLETIHNRTSVLLAQFFTGGPVDQRAVLAAMLTANALTVVCFQLLAARFVRKREPVTSMTVGGLLTFAGMVGFAVAQAPWQFVAAMIVFSIGETVIAPAEFALVDRIAPERLERAALSRSSSVRLSVVSWRTRCLRVVFSVVIRWMASWVHSACLSRIWPRSSPVRVRWVRISALAALSACSALSARSRQVGSCWSSGSVSSWRCCRPAS